MKLYIWILSSVLAGVFVLTIASTAVLWRSGETWPVSWIVAGQQQQPSIWGAGIRPDEVGYKRQLYVQRQPDVIAVGSSRVLQFRADMFAAPFANLGRGTGVLEFLEDYRALTQGHAPKFVLWGIDHSIFEKSTNDEKRVYGSQQRRVSGKELEGSYTLEVIPRTMYSLWQLVRNGSIGIDKLGHVLIDGSAYPGKRYGLLATTTNQGGYFGDGSYYYLHEIANPAQTQALLERRMDELDRASLPVSGRVPETLDAEMAQIVRRAVQYMREQGSVVFIVVPPMHEKVSRNMLRDPAYAPYLDEVDEFLRSLASSEEGVYYRNSLQPERIGVVSECEFFDHQHSTRQAAAKMLLDGVQAYGAAISDWLNMDVVRSDAAGADNRSTYEFDANISLFIGTPNETLNGCD